jgi:hypothetical protein
MFLGAAIRVAYDIALAHSRSRQPFDQTQLAVTCSLYFAIEAALFFCQR